MKMGTSSILKTGAKTNPKIRQILADSRISDFGRESDAADGALPAWWFSGLNGDDLRPLKAAPQTKAAATSSVVGLDPDTEASAATMKARFAALDESKLTAKTREVERAFAAIEAKGGDRLSVSRAKSAFLSRFAHGGGPDSGLEQSEAPSIVPANEATAPQEAS